MKLKDIMNEMKITEAKDYYRIPKKIIGNELYVAGKLIEDIAKTAENENDFNMVRFDQLLDVLNKVKKSAKKFKSGEEPSGDYK